MLLVSNVKWTTFAALPCSFRSLRQVPAYPRYINEIFERCLDLYLCPRQKKDRVRIYILFSIYLQFLGKHEFGRIIYLLICKTKILDYVLLFLF